MQVRKNAWPFWTWCLNPLKMAQTRSLTTRLKKKSTQLCLKYVKKVYFIVCYVLFLSLDKSISSILYKINLIRIQFKTQRCLRRSKLGTLIFFSILTRDQVTQRLIIHNNFCNIYFRATTQQQLAPVSCCASWDFTKTYKRRSMMNCTRSSVILTDQLHSTTPFKWSIWSELSWKPSGCTHLYLS